MFCSARSGGPDLRSVRCSLFPHTVALLSSGHLHVYSRLIADPVLRLRTRSPGNRRCEGAGTPATQKHPTPEPRP